jgi:hypothetical protein
MSLLMSQRRQPCALCGQPVWSRSCAQQPILSQQNRISRRGQTVVCVAHCMVGRGKTGAAYSLEFSNCARTAMMSVIWCSFGFGLVVEGGKGRRSLVFSLEDPGGLIALVVLFACRWRGGEARENGRYIFQLPQSGWGSFHPGKLTVCYRLLRHAELMTGSVMHETRYSASLIQGLSIHLRWQVKVVLDIGTRFWIFDRPKARSCNCPSTLLVTVVNYTP